MARLQGIDVSEYQGYVHWDQVKKAGIVWACAKATEGLRFQDPYFAHNWYGMKRRDIVRGAYHFLHPSWDGRSQADFFHSHVHHNGGFESGDFIMVDVEIMDKQSPDFVLECLEAFIIRALETISKQVVVYTGPSFWEGLGDMPKSIIHNRPLWVAEYGPIPPATLPHWSVVSFWQNGDNGQLPGVRGFVDTDVFFGSMDQLVKVLKWP